MKKVKSYRLLEETIEIIEKLSKKTGKPQSQIIDEAVKFLLESENKTSNEIELYKRENEQLKMVIKVFQEREKAIQKVEESYERLVKEKDARIKELQDMIDTLKNIQEKNRKRWWNFWK